ncbi:DUF757-domain-containing protein [Armillaria luteobubalina]|uniref:DUF757-domain-containing protein n=1 Tax=Armillaria luteobubalina TaxID=153913 RepID=A0AA39Q9Z5_9AGAR|nr:DUF757-domain-containing protein [Armillaria luteobubalina]
MAGKFDAQNAQNLVEVAEDFTGHRFAVKAVEQAQVYWNLLEKIPPRQLRLTKLDDEIFEHTLKTFPEMTSEPYDKLIKLDEDWMKSKEGKERWRVFIQTYEKKIQDYNFGSLIRTDSRKNMARRTQFSVRGATKILTRIQFYAIEISRNRLGLNDAAHEVAKVSAEKERRAEQEKKKKTKSS